MVAPPAKSVELLPLQTVGDDELTVTVGIELTVTTALPEKEVPVQLASLKAVIT